MTGAPGIIAELEQHQEGLDDFCSWHGGCLAGAMGFCVWGSANILGHSQGSRSVGQSHLDVESEEPKNAGDLIWTQLPVQVGGGNEKVGDPFHGRGRE